MKTLPHKIALKLKELGFDKPCLCVFPEGSIESRINTDAVDWNNFVNGNTISAPTYYDAVDWFIDKHKLSVEVTWDGPYEYEEGKMTDGIWEINIVHILDWEISWSPDWQRHSGEQLEREPAQHKAINEAINYVLNNHG